MLKQNYVVYRHRNKATNEIFYVGSGSLKRAGRKQYKTESWKNIVSKYEYVIEIVSEELPLDDSLDLEYLMIDTYGTIIDGDGPLVNIRRDRHKLHSATISKLSKSLLGNDRALGFNHSKETKYKMASSRLSEGNPMFGKVHSEETKSKISKAKLGIGLSEDHKRKISETITGRMIGDKNGMFGKKHSDETRAKISKSNLGRKPSEETVEKFRVSLRRKYISDENYKLLLEDFSKIDKIIYGVTYKELSIRYKVSYKFTSNHYRKYKNK